MYADEARKLAEVTQARKVLGASLTVVEQMAGKGAFQWLWNELSPEKQKAFESLGYVVQDNGSNVIVKW